MKRLMLLVLILGFTNSLSAKSCKELGEEGLNLSDSQLCINNSYLGLNPRDLVSLTNSGYFKGWNDKNGNLNLNSLNIQNLFIKAYVSKKRGEFYWWWNWDMVSKVGDLQFSIEMGKQISSIYGDIRKEQDFSNIRHKYNIIKGWETVDYEFMKVTKYKKDLEEFKRIVLVPFLITFENLDKKGNYFKNWEKNPKSFAGTVIGESIKSFNANKGSYSLLIVGLLNNPTDRVKAIELLFNKKKRDNLIKQSKFSELFLETFDRLYERKY